MRQKRRTPPIPILFLLLIEGVRRERPLPRSRLLWMDPGLLADIRAASLTCGHHREKMRCQQTGGGTGFPGCKREEGVEQRVTEWTGFSMMLLPCRVSALGQFAGAWASARACGVRAESCKLVPCSVLPALHTRMPPGWCKE